MGKAGKVSTPWGELRARSGLNQTEFAESIGCWQSQISRATTEAVPPPIGRDVVLRCADLYRPLLIELGLTVEDLLRNTRPGQSAIQQKVNRARVRGQKPGVKPRRSSNGRAR